MPRFIETVFEEGTISTIYGTPGAGKTNLAVVFMEKAIEQGYDVYTIINFFKYEQIPLAIKKGKLKKFPGHVYRRTPPELHTVTSLSELLMGLLTTEKNVAFLDEMGFFGSSTAPTSKKVRTLKEIAFICRHLDASLVFIAQSKGSLVPDLRETLVQYEMRISRVGSSDIRRFTIAMAMPTKNEFGEDIVDFVEVDEYYGVPPATYPFDSKYLPKFTFDIDLSEVLEKLGPYNSLEVKEIGPRIIKEMMEKKKTEKKKEKQKSKRDIVLEKLALHPNEPAEAIAVLAGCSSHYVEKIKRQLRHEEKFLITTKKPQPS